MKERSKQLERHVEQPVLQQQQQVWHILEREGCCEKLVSAAGDKDSEQEGGLLQHQEGMPCFLYTAGVSQGKGHDDGYSRGTTRYAGRRSVDRWETAESMLTTF